MSRGAACCAPTYYVGTPLMSAHIGGLNARPHARHRPCPLRRVFWRQYGQVRRRARLAHGAPAGFDPREVADPRSERGGERDAGGGFHERPDSGHRQRLPVSPHPLGVSLTLPELGDRFKLTDVILDSARVAVSGTCRFKGALVFAVPRAETLAVTWYGSPEQALIYGWPVDLGPFAGVGASRVGDSLVGAILFDSQLGVQVRPGVTARFVAGRARREAR